ncbi:TRAP transporter small permease [Treponema parvum]|uniref:TRAP transporter small permease n=1 Tax=Treponema parvum TaxID=138851 RepID=A0A975EZC8_9SPIR|nr:TRAP transporter small permease [Treponema parvum]QTQ11588.1 TRAP transporter small permease [Treponema parvum]
MKLIRLIINGIVVALFALLVIIVFMQVLFRYVFQSALPWADEAARYCFIWLIYLGGTITIRKGMNITFDLLLDSLSKKYGLAFLFIVNICCELFLLTMVVLGINLCWVNRVQFSTILHLNMGLVMMAIPLGGALMFIEQILYQKNKIDEKAAVADCKK